MIRPHDTDRILAVLGEAIENLRSSTLDRHEHSLTAEVANDLALLHGTVSAEAQQADEARTVKVVRGRKAVTLPISAFQRRQTFVQRMKREEIQAEVDRGDHRDDDWREDG